MRDGSLPTPEGSLDEQRLTRWISLGLPAVTVLVAIGVGVAAGPAPSILVLAAGLLLGVIGLFWTSIRILSGDAELSPELAALDTTAQGVDTLSSRKKMLLRALKDLENERAIGKMEDEDFEQIASTYRAELKGVLQRIDESLAPHRARAEEALRGHLEKVGLTEAAPQETAPEPEPVAQAAPARVSCASCGESNEPDAKFCKGCATKLTVVKAEDASDA